MLNRSLRPQTAGLGPKTAALCVALLHGSASTMAAAQAVLSLASQRQPKLAYFGFASATLPSPSALPPSLSVCSTRLHTQAAKFTGALRRQMRDTKLKRRHLHSSQTTRMQRDEGRVIRAPASPVDATSIADASVTEVGSVQQKWKQLLWPTGAGQYRPHLCPSARRSWTDPHMASHVAFVPAIVCSCSPSSPLPELAALQSIVLVLSLIYHRNYERPGALASVEGLFAKALFMYGTAQTFYSPTHALLFANGACFLATAGAFFATNTNKSLYDRWHPLGLHLVPGLWATLVALNHTSLLPPAVVAEIVHVSASLL